MSSNLELVLLERLNDIRTYGEALKILGQYALYFKNINLEEKYNYKIREVLGLTPKGERGPNSYHFGLFEIRVVEGRIPSLQWTFYRVNEIEADDDGHVIGFEFVGNNGEKEEIFFLDRGIYMFTTNYFLLLINNILTIYHLRPLESHIVFKKEVPFKGFFNVVERYSSLILIYSFEKTSFVISKIPFDTWEIIVLRTLDRERINDRMGYYGFYKNNPDRPDDLFFIDYISSESHNVHANITYASGAINVAYNVYKTLDIIFINSNVGCIYDAQNAKLAWLFDNNQDYRIYESFFIANNRVICDIFTGRQLLNLHNDGISITITRKDDDSGYWVWKYLDSSSSPSSSEDE